MNKLLIPLVFFAASFICCNNSPSTTDTTSTSGTTRTTDIIGKEWKLIKVYINGSETLFNRSQLNSDSQEFFTLIIDEKNVSGRGAPNLYSAPYTQNDDQSISIKLLRSTLMATIFEPENLKEHDYYSYIQNAYKWLLVNEYLEISSKDGAAKEVKLVFSL